MTKLLELADAYAAACTERTLVRRVNAHAALVAEIERVERDAGAKSAGGEPVAWRPKLSNPIPFVTGKPRESDLSHWRDSMNCEIEYAYTIPPAEKREPLTDKQIDELSIGMRNAVGGIYSTSVYKFARAIESAHGIGTEDVV